MERGAGEEGWGVHQRSPVLAKSPFSLGQGAASWLTGHMTETKEGLWRLEWSVATGPWVQGKELDIGGRKGILTGVMGGMTGAHQDCSFLHPGYVGDTPRPLLVVRYG